MTLIPGLTKMRSVGPLAREVERAGGSLRRVFARAELPLALIDEPERLILLRDQLALLETAAREIGDDALAARLSTGGGLASLGRYAAFMSAAEDLRGAIGRANASVGALLQSATALALDIEGTRARWSYVVTDNSRQGRQQNEVLALGYMLGLLRYFLGERWAPLRASVGGGVLSGRSANAAALGCDLCVGARAEIEFDARLLDAANAAPRAGETPCVADVPADAKLVETARHLIELGLLERRPTIDWLSRRLDMPRRTLQRRLAQEGRSFDGLLQEAVIAEAQQLLADRGASITMIAQTLGYSDQAHFTRAFLAATGATPGAWRATRAH